MEMKGITCKIPQDLHAKITEEIRASGSTMSKFIEMVINSYYDNKENGKMKKAKPRTLAFPVTQELFDKVKTYLDEYERVYGRKLTQIAFLTSLVEQALEEAPEEFEAARAAQSEAARDAGQVNDEAEADPNEGIEADEGEAEPGNDAIPEAGAEPAEDADGAEE